MRLRPYQEEAVAAVLADLGRRRSTLAVMPTGTGKTLVFAAVAKAMRPRGRALVLAHTEELINQAATKIQRAVGLECGVEAGAARISAGELPDVLVASIQTMGREARRARFDPADFALVVVDEAHHASARTYGDVLEYFSAARVLGVTATPDRLDGASLRRAFQNVAFVYEIRQAVADGWLVPIRQKRVIVESLDLAGVKITSDGDYDPHALEAALMREQTLHEIAAPVLALSGERPTLVFTPTVSAARELAKVIEARAGARCVQSIDGSMSSEERGSVLAAFARGRIRVLVNCALLTEGFDHPPIACIAVARPTRSRALYAQMVGRGTRPSDETAKTDLLVLDFEGQSVDHQLVTPAMIIDPGIDLAVAERADRILRRDGFLAVHEALDRAEQELADERREAELRKAEELRRQVDRARQSVSTAVPKFRTFEVDPFSVLGIAAPTGRPGEAPATEAQLRALANFRFDVPASGMTKRQAHATISVLVERAEHGLCTYRQGRILMRFGLSPDASRESAGRALDGIKATGWRSAPAWCYADPDLRWKAGADDAA